MKNNKFTKDRMLFYAEQIVEYCNIMDTCRECVFRDHEKACCGLTNAKDVKQSPFMMWNFE